MPLSDAQAARTVCRDHLQKNTTQLRGSLRGVWYSQCEAKRTHRCKFSHTMFNLQRIPRLGHGTPNCSIVLKYGYGFERYGAYEDWRSGWDVVVNGKTHTGGGSNVKQWNLPKSILITESALQLPAFTPKESKIQAMCQHFEKNDGCDRPSCRFDHDIIEAKRLESLVLAPDRGMSQDHQYLDVECHVTNGIAVWKITMRPDAFKQNDPRKKSLPPLPFSYEDANLFKLVRRFEDLLLPKSNGSVPRSQHGN